LYAGESCPMQHGGLRCPERGAEWQHPSFQEWDGLDGVEAEYAPGLRDCFADACLEGEEEQLADLLRLRSAFIASQRNVRCEVEAEVRKFAECPWDVNSALGQYTDILSADGRRPISPLAALPSAPSSPASSAAATSPSPSPRARAPPWDPKELRPPQPFRGANSAPESPAGVAPNSTFRRPLPARSSSSRAGGGVSEVSTSASSVGSSPVKPRCKQDYRLHEEAEAQECYADRLSAAKASQARRSIAQRLQQKLQERQTELPELGAEKQTFDSHGDSFGEDGSTEQGSPHVDLRRSIAQRLQQRLQQRQAELPEHWGDKQTGCSCPREDDDFGGEADWYAPPDSYNWSSMSGSAYSSSSPKAGSCSAGSGAARDPHGVGSYAFRYSTGEHRTSTRCPSMATPSSGASASGVPASGSASKAPPSQPPPLSTPPHRPAPRPPPTRPGPVHVHAAGSWPQWRRHEVPNMHFPGCIPGQRQSYGASWCPPVGGAGTRRAGAQSPTGGGTPRQQPKPSPQQQPTPRPNRAGAVEAPRTKGEATAVQHLEVRLQELRRVCKEEQRKGCKELLVQWHPDKNPDRGEEATRVFQWLQNRRKEVLGF